MIRNDDFTMKISFSIGVMTATALLLGVATVSFAAGQATAKNAASASRTVVLRAELKPGEVLRYELEGSVSFLPQAETLGAEVSPPRGPCDYSLAAIVTLRPRPADKDGNTPVEATYSEARVTSTRCPAVSQADFEKRLASLQSNPVMFRVGPHGETGVLPFRRRYFEAWNGSDFLRKLTLDLLQTKFSPQPVAPGASWRPSGQFAYAKDYALRHLELSGANIRFRDIVDVAGTRCAWVDSKYVFSPLDFPASATTREGRVVQNAANNAVAAVLEISLLLDTAGRHVAWLHRSQIIDNRLTLGSASAQDDDPDPASDDPSSDAPDTYPDSDQPDNDRPDDDRPDADAPIPNASNIRVWDRRHPFMSFHFEEDGRARLLPQGSNMEWLAALRRFEAAPQPEMTAATERARAAAAPGPIAKAANSAVMKKTSRVVVDSDTLLSTPVGFTRYEKAFCRDTWFCATVSVALPGNIEISDDTVLHSVYLAKKEGVVVSVSVGPALDRRYPGLTEEEELKKHAKYYLSNYVWMAIKPGIEARSSPATLDGYPGLITEFSATQRDLANMHGVLGLILTPWGKVVPVSCAFDQAPSADLQSLCERIVTSVSLRR
jgi:hypothetical protein